ncbi:MAG: sulfatase [Myxococcota bacterium]
MRPCSIFFVAGLAACQSQTSLTVAAETQASVEAHVPTVDNVILITVDTLRADVLGTYGGRARTPVIDELAARGWTFDNCISASMLTNPSHASIMTSLYPRDHGVDDNESGIADGVRTLATAMRRHGARTAAVIGFPHLNPEVSNLGQGFDRVVPATRDELRADETSRRALVELDRFDAGEKFFLWIHYVDPHAPYEPPDTHAPPHLEVAGKARPLSVALEAAPGFQRHNPWFKTAFRKYGTVEHMIERYVAEVEATDSGLRVLFDGMAKRGLMSKTAIVLTSDHGENLGEHNLYFHHGGLYRATVHVPLIVAVPGATALRVAGQVETVDIAPTVLELVSAPRWEPMRGRSLVNVAYGRQPPRRFVFSEHMLSQQIAVRSLQGTMILHRKTTRQFPTYHFEAGRQEIYDSRNDPGETHELGDNNSLSTVLGAALQGYLEAGLKLSARSAVAQDRESLRALGYIE